MSLIYVLSECWPISSVSQSKTVQSSPSPSLFKFQSSEEYVHKKERNPSESQNLGHDSTKLNEKHTANICIKEKNENINSSLI